MENEDYIVKSPVREIQKVYACRRSETPVGKVPEQSFYDIFTGEEMDKYRQYDKFEHCSKCEIKTFAEVVLQLQNA